MASGKTTFGRALAKALGCKFIDLDEYIVDRQAMTVNDIFSKYGEQYFRDLESSSLTDIIDNEAPAIVACGGGTPCFGSNLEHMSEAGLTVWLDAPTATILHRLREDRAGRPLVASLDKGNQLDDYVTENLSRRHPFYSRAEMRFDSSRLESTSEIDESVDSFITLLQEK